MTNLEQIAEWHKTKPPFARHFTARDWDTAEVVASALDAAGAAAPESCLVAPDGWYCTRQKGHDGPCAAYPLGADD